MNSYLGMTMVKIIISVNKAYFSLLPAYISPLIISSTYLGW